MKAAEGGPAIENIGLKVGDVLTVIGKRGEYNVPLKWLMATMSATRLAAWIRNQNLEIIRIPLI